MPRGPICALTGRVPEAHTVVTIGTWVILGSHHQKMATQVARAGNDFRHARQSASGGRRRGRVLLDEVLPLQLQPKLGRDRRLQGGHIGEDLRLGMRADEQRRGDVRRHRELKRSSSQVGAELGRHSAQLFALLDVLAGNIPGRLAIVVARTAGDETGVQRRADYKLHVALTRHREDVVERVRMVDQRVLRGGP